MAEERCIESVVELSKDWPSKEEEMQEALERGVIVHYEMKYELKSVPGVLEVEEVALKFEPAVPVSTAKSMEGEEE